MAHIDDRLQRLRDNRIDWSTAEAMALGSLLYQGFNVRLSGQDVGRGTFSHRHVMLVDQDSDTAHIPLNSLTESQTNFIEVMMGTKINFYGQLFLIFVMAFLILRRILIFVL